MYFRIYCLFLNQLNNKAAMESPIDYSIDETRPIYNDIDKIHSGLFDGTNDSSNEVQPNKAKGEITRKPKMKENLTLEIISLQTSKMIKLLPTNAIKLLQKPVLQELRSDQTNIP